MSAIKPDTAAAWELIKEQRHDNGLADIDDYEQRVRVLEAEGMTRSDAQAVADAELEPELKCGATICCDDPDCSERGEI